MARYERKDRFHQRAKREGYRSRAAYKLLELAKGQRLLRRGDRVVDLGCWPGGWLQVAAAQVGAGGRVVGVDLAAIEPPLVDLANVVAFVGDISEPAVLEEVLEALGKVRTRVPWAGRIWESGRGTDRCASRRAWSVQRFV